MVKQQCSAKRAGFIIGMAVLFWATAEVGEATLFGRVKAIRVTVENPAGYVISKNLAARRPVKRAIED